MRIVVVKVLSSSARWVDRILGVRLPMRSTFGLR